MSIIIDSPLSGNKCWSTNVGAKLLPGLVTISILFPDIPLGPNKQLFNVKFVFKVLDHEFSV